MTWAWLLNRYSTSAEAEMRLTTHYKLQKDTNATCHKYQHSSVLWWLPAAQPSQSCSGHQTYLQMQVATFWIVPTLSSGCCREMGNGVQSNTGWRAREHCWDCPTRCAQGSWRSHSHNWTYCRCTGPQGTQGTTQQALPVNLSLCKPSMLQNSSLSVTKCSGITGTGLSNKAAKHTQG